MVKQIFPAIAIIFLLSSCTAFKSLNLNNRSEVTAVAAPQTKFIDNITVTPPSESPKVIPEAPVVKVEKKDIKTKETFSTGGVNIVKPQIILAEKEKLTETVDNSSDIIENASPIELKYAVLLNTEVESLPNKALLESVDEWYGVRYRRGGNGKTGIDCSGFTLAVFEAAYGITIPRVSREQYRVSNKISMTELKEGDLVFFNTVGRGVSHVGVYLGNNKFIHSTVSKGVMVNDLYESYYVKRYIGAGRIDDKHPEGTHDKHSEGTN